MLSHIVTRLGHLLFRPASMRVSQASVAEMLHRPAGRRPSISAACPSCGLYVGADLLSQQQARPHGYDSPIAPVRSNRAITAKTAKVVAMPAMRSL
jgi:hypothetical protein